MTQPAEFVAVDWGTSSLRLWHIGTDGQSLHASRSNQGMLGLAPEDFPSVLETHLAHMNVPPGVPAIICGMAGAKTGWIEAPYCDAPTDLRTLADCAVETSTQHRRAVILPGIAQRAKDDPDVMRGEETLLLGAHIQAQTDGLVCLPGTHSKWAQLASGRLMSFQTSMTGETFALFAGNSTLAQYASGPIGDFSASDAFTTAVRDALEAPERILHALFSVRATPLVFGDQMAPQMQARLSGLLIGQEIAGMRVAPGTSVTLISTGHIARTYAHALSVAGARVTTLEATEMVLAGLSQCAAQFLLFHDA